MAEPTKNINQKLFESMNIVWEIVVIVALPTTLLALGGRWLDRHFHATPWFTLLGLVVALLTAYLLVSMKAMEIAKRLGEKTE